jgi:periplasmic divalent cation tolerance protein
MSAGHEAAHVVYVTVGNRAEALAIAREVVTEGLAACANLLDGVTSIYEWKDEVHEDVECILILKTVSARLSDLTERVVQLHSYECPCVVSWPTAGGHEPFLNWVREQTQPG